MVFTPPPRPRFRRPVYKRRAVFRACDDAQERGFDLVFGAIFAPESKSGWRTDARRTAHHRGCLLCGRIASFRVASTRGHPFGVEQRARGIPNRVFSKRTLCGFPNRPTG